MVLTSLLLAAALVELYLLSRQNFLAFHCIVELFSIIVASSIFILSWNARQYLGNSFLSFLGIAYLFVALLDTLHMSSYKGMGIIEPGGNADAATQLWVAARFLQSGSILAMSAGLHRFVKTPVQFLGLGSVTMLFLACLYLWDCFPACFVEGQGLTSFKVFSEYWISGILALSMGLLYRNRASFHPPVVRLIIASIGVTILSELAFTLYTDVYGLSNIVGHLLKLVSFFLVYKAIVETGLTRPYAILFRGFKEKEDILRRLSFQDELTGLYNRRGFMSFATRQMKLAKRTKRSVYLVFADVDGMKEINDQHGHAAGDEALRTTGRVLTDAFRESDIIARIGGDEFTVLMLESAENQTSNIRHRLSEILDAVQVSGRLPFRLSVSSGVGRCDPGEPCSLEKLLERADRDMYRNRRMQLLPDGEPSNL